MTVNRRLLVLVGAMLLASMALAAAVVGAYGDRMAPLPAVPFLSGWPLALVLVVATFLAEATYVRIDHGGSSEEVALFEAAVVLDALLLNPVMALVVTTTGYALAALLRRRPLVKSLFNFGMHAAAIAAMLLVITAFRGQPNEFSAQLIVALLVGTAVFAAVNLGCLGAALQVVSKVPVMATVRDQWRLSVLMIFGTVAVGTTAGALALHAPLLLPFVAMPAASLTYAYRARAIESVERNRASRLFTLSEVLAGRYDPDELLSTFVTTVTDAFGSDDAVVVLAPAEGGVPAAVGLHEDGAPYDARQPATPEQARLLELAGTGLAARYATHGLPTGWRQAIVAPLEAGGGRLGVVVLGWRRKSGQLDHRDATMLTPVASSLAFALRGAEALQRLLDETSKLQAVVDQSSDGILVLDGQGTVEIWNDALTSMTGLSSVDAVGLRLGDVVSASDTQGNDVDFFKVGSDQLTPASPRTTVEVALRRTNGEQRWTRCAHAGVFRDGSLERDVVIVHDVTRERQVERLKSDFIATVSHELRTPVTPIKGYAELLRSRGDRMTPEKRAEALDFIIERSGHLSRLVEDLLLASRISNGKEGPQHKVRLMPADLSEILRTAVGDVADEGRLVVDAQSPSAPVQADPVRARQVLVNLISNGLKYSPATEVVHVTLWVDEVDNEVAVAVRDSGRGIPVDQLEAVFEKFHRVEDPMRMTTSGTGLGLYIAQQLALAMHGRIEVDSTLGLGSTFTFFLPLDGATREALPVAAAPGSHAWRVGSAENLTAAGG